MDRNGFIPMKYLLVPDESYHVIPIPEDCKLELPLVESQKLHEALEMPGFFIGEASYLGL